MAEDMFDNMTGEQVVDALRKQNVSMVDMPQRITAARTYLESHAQKVASLSKVADAMPTNGIAFDELKKAMTHLYDIHESVAGMSKSIGRALDAHKIVVGESAVDNADRAAVEHLTTIAQKQALEDMSKAELLATARIIRMSEGNPKEILALMRGESHAVTRQKEPDADSEDRRWREQLPHGSDAVRTPHRVRQRSEQRYGGCSDAD
jgi:hypothetical protein